MHALDPSEPPAQEVRRVTGKLVSEAIAALHEGADAGDLSRSVHTARKRLKEIRAVIRLVRPALGDATARNDGRAFRDVGRRLSEARDAEVAASVVAGIVGEVTDGPPEHLRRIHMELEARREAAQASFLDDRSALEDVLARLGELSRRVDAWALRDVDWGLMAGTIARTYRRGRSAYRTAERDDVETEWHEARKRTKDLWYQTDLLRAAWPTGLAGQSAAAHELADVLGDMQDLHVVRGMVERGRGTDWNAAGADALRDAADARLRALRSRATWQGRRVYAEEPKAFASRFRMYVGDIEPRAPVVSTRDAR